MKPVRFYPNTKNDLRCVQAVLRMVLRAEGKSYTYAELDRLTKRRLKDWTWNAPVQIAMHNLGFTCLLYEDFSYHRFTKQGHNYLNKTFGQDWTDTEAKHTNISLQQLWARKMIGEIGPARPAAKINDIQKLFKRGYYVAPTVNAAKLHRKNGCINHLVLVTNMDKKTITIHDPGLPPHPNWSIHWTQFTPAFTGTLKAWKLSKNGQ